MTKSTYFIYAAADDHKFLGRIRVADNKAGDVDALMAMARKKFKTRDIRIECKPRAYRPPSGRIKVQPVVARIGRWQ